METTCLSQSVPRRRRVMPLARWAFGCVVVVLTVLSFLLSTTAPPNVTAAQWHSSRAPAGGFQAGSLPAPTLTAPCQFRPGLLGLGAHVRIFWSLPEGYTLDDVEVHASTSGLGSVLAPLTGFNLSGNTVTTGQGYQTDVPTNLLGGLLGLGSELEIAIVVRDGPWTSLDAASVASNAGLLGGIGGNCRNLT